MTYSLACSCGDILSVKGQTREDAVNHMKTLMSAATVYEHMAQKHIGDSVPTIEQVHEIIEQNLKASRDEKSGL